MSVASLVPNADFAAGAWASTAATLWSAVDECPPQASLNAADYWATNTLGDVAVVEMSTVDMAGGVATGYTIYAHLTLDASAGNDTPEVKVELTDTANVGVGVALDTFVGGWVSQVSTGLSLAQAAVDSLRLRVTAVALDGPLDPNATRLFVRLNAAYVDLTYSPAAAGSPMRTVV